MTHTQYNGSDQWQKVKTHYRFGFIILFFSSAINANCFTLLKVRYLLKFLKPNLHMCFQKQNDLKLCNSNSYSITVAPEKLSRFSAS